MDAVLFDLDGTLCTYRRPGREVLAAAFDRAGVEPCFAIEDYYAAYDEYAAAADTVDAQREACFASLAAAGGETAALGRAVARAYAADRDHRNVAFLDGARSILQSFAAEYRVGLVTNGAPEMQATKLSALGIQDVFETVVHGGFDAPPKPSPEPFHAALEALGVDANRSVHVGNSLAADVAGAKAAGIRAVWLRRDEAAGDPGAGRPDETIASLSELAGHPWR